MKLKHCSFYFSLCLYVAQAFLGRFVQVDAGVRSPQFANRVRYQVAHVKAKGYCDLANR